MVGAITFELIKALVDDIHTVTDAQLIDVMRFYAERMKMIVEPTGCLSLAAAIQAREVLKGQRVGVIISGGNVDMARFSQLLAQQPSPCTRWVTPAGRNSIKCGVQAAGKPAQPRLPCRGLAAGPPLHRWRVVLHPWRLDGWLRVRQFPEQWQ